MKVSKIAKFLLILLTVSSCDISLGFTSFNSSSSSEILSEEVSEILSEFYSSSEEISSSYFSSLISSTSEMISSSSNVSSSYYSNTSSFTVSETGKYKDVESVAMYITLYHKLPSNYVSKNQASNYDNSYSIGGDYFGNYEGYLPSSYNGSYRECDIGSTKNNRGSKRIVFEVRTYRIFYTEDHYKNFREYYGYKNWSERFGASNDIY